MDIGVLHSVVGEVWVPVKGFPNYVVSNRGRVYSLTREETWGDCTRIRQGRILTPRLGDRGYYYVVLCDNGRNQTKLRTFIGSLPKRSCRIPNIWSA